MKSKERQLRKLAESMIRKDFNPKFRGQAIRAFIENPPPDWEQLIELQELEEQNPSTVFSIDTIKEIMDRPADAAFTTARLKVFRSQLALPDELCPARLLFVAFRTDRLPPRVCATALIAFYPLTAKGLTPSCDWIEVTPESRRLGLATEFIDGIEKHTGWIINLIDSEPYFLRAVRKARTARLSPSHTLATKQNRNNEGRPLKPNPADGPGQHNN